MYSQVLPSVRKSLERFLEETVSYIRRNGSRLASRQALLDVGLCGDPLNLLENRCIHGRLGIWDGVGEMDEESGSTPGLLHQQEAPFSGPATSPSVAKFSSPSPCLDTGFWTPEEEWLHRDNLSKGFPPLLETGLLLTLA